MPGLTAVFTSLAGPLDQWHWRNPWPQGAPLQRVTYGNGLYAAAGGVGTNLVMLSADGATWASVNAAGLYALTDIIHAKGLFVAVDERSGIATSPDGTNWTVRVAPASDYFPIYSLAYGNGIFVGVGYGLFCYTSSDGITWTKRTFIGAEPRTVCFGNGRFVAAQNGTQIYVSSNGIDWTRVGMATGFVGDVASGVYGGGRFVLVGGAGTFIGSTMTSVDGSTWFTPSPVNPSIAFGLKGVTYGPNGYVAVGMSSSQLITSSNGSNWVSRPSAASNLLFGVTSVGDRYVGVGNLGQIVVSTDSTNWAAVTTQAVPFGLLDVAWLNDRFVAVGGVGTIGVSSEGRQWRGVRLPSNANLEAVTWGNGVFVAGDDSWGIVTSTNALDWARQSVAFKTKAVAFGNGMFVALDDGAEIWTSTNGTNWTAPATDLTENARRVVFLNQRFWAVGASGAVAKSTNAVNWTDRSVGFASTLQAITWLKDRYVVVGLVGDSFTSPDGVQWTRHASGDLRMFYDVAANGRFAVAAGWKGTRYVSTDGANWTPLPLQALRDLSGIAFGSGTFVAVGAGGTILQSDPLLELDLKTTPVPEVTVEGPSGLPVRIETAPALSGGASWQTATSLTLTNGTARWTPPPPDGTNRFYRAVAE